MKRALLLMMITLSWTVEAQISSDCPTVGNEEQIFCSTTAATVSHLDAQAGTDGLSWYATPQGGAALSPLEPLIDGQTYYAGNESGNCSNRESVLVQIDPQPIAGRTSSAYFCANDGPVDLVEYMAPSNGRPAQPGGTFSPSLSSGTTIFDPSIDRAGRYTYTVSSPYGVCPSDDARITVFIAPAPNAGEDGMVTIGSEDDPVDLFSYLGGTPDLGGTWSPELASGSGIFDPELDPSGTYTYTVAQATLIGNSTYGTRNKTCTDTAVVQVVVQGDSQTICHKGETIIVSSNAIEAHLRHGDTLGSCDNTTSFSVDVVVSPNPSRGLFGFSTDNATISSIGIKNMRGEILRHMVIENSPRNYELDLADLKPGLYFAEVLTDKGISVNRIIKK